MAFFPPLDGSGSEDHEKWQRRDDSNIAYRPGLAGCACHACHNMRVPCGNLLSLAPSPDSQLRLFGLGQRSRVASADWALRGWRGTGETDVGTLLGLTKRALKQ